MPPPAEPLVGAMAVMVVCWVKVRPLLTAASPTPATDTTTESKAPSGASPTVQLIESLLAATTTHATPPSITSGTPVKPLPWTCTVLPTWPAAGLTLATVGAAAYVKVPAAPAAKSASPISGTEIVTLSANVTPCVEAGVVMHTAVRLALSSGQATPPMVTVALMLPLSLWPYRQSVAPPRTDPSTVDWASTRGELSLLSIWKPAIMSLVPTISPVADSTETRRSHNVPASVNGDTLGCVRHVSVPRLLLVLSTAHAASVPPPLVRSSTCIRVASSSKPSPERVSTTPPAALPAATLVPPLEVSVATLARESTPATLVLIGAAAYPSVSTCTSVLSLEAAAHIGMRQRTLVSL